MTEIRNSPRRISRVILWAAISACVPEPDSDTPAYHIELIFDDSEQSACAGTPAYLDRYAERIFEFFGAPLPADFQVAVRIGAAAAPCSNCYRPAEKTLYIGSLGSSGINPLSTIQHELAHAFVDRLWGRSIPFFNEGLAEAFAGIDLSGPALPVGPMLDQPPLGVDYGAASRFIRFLIDTRGLDNFKRLFQGVKIASMDEIRAKFAEIYGESFDAIEVEYLSKSERCRYQFDSCDPLEVEQVATYWSLSLAASCLDGDFYGGADGEGGQMAAQRTLEVEFTGPYRLRTSRTSFVDSDGHPKPSRVILTRCGDCDDQYVRELYDEEELQLTAGGIYTISFVPAGESVISLDIEYLGALP